MVSCRRIFLSITLVVLASNQCECGIYDIIRTLIQYNVVGTPVYLQTTKWDFDPDVSKKRREHFYELHGYRAEKYLERIGTGVDGKHRYRQQQNDIRDENHLQGLNYLRP
ncbi:unnamed protein product [Diamesa hyperborea]